MGEAGNASLGGTGEDRFRKRAIASIQVVRPESKVAEDEGRVTRPRLLDVAELPANPPELEDAAGALERVLGLGQLARLERRGQGVVGHRNGGRERVSRLLGPRRHGRCEQERRGAGRQAQTSHR